MTGRQREPHVLLAGKVVALLADEPTGQLDSQTGRSIMVLLQQLMRTEGITAIVATHDAMLIDLADRVLELADGRVIADTDATADGSAAAD